MFTFEVKTPKIELVPGSHNINLIPEEIKNLINLEHLVLISNNIKIIPTEIKFLTKFLTKFMNFLCRNPSVGNFPFAVIFLMSFNLLLVDVAAAHDKISVQLFLINVAHCFITGSFR